MQNDLRAILELRGLSKTATDRESREFFFALPLEDKIKIGKALAYEPITSPPARLTS